MQSSPVENTIRRHTNESTLAFYLENNYYERTYRALVEDSVSRNSRVYPAYEFVEEDMIKCLPENIKNSEIEVCVPLQSLLNKTTERLCESVAQGWEEHCLHNLELTVTLGFDSSSGHTNAQQKCLDLTNEYKMCR